MGVVWIPCVVHGRDHGGRLEMRLWLCLGGARARAGTHVRARARARARGGRRRVTRTCDR